MMTLQQRIVTGSPLMSVVAMTSILTGGRTRSHDAVDTTSNRSTDQAKRRAAPFGGWLDIRTRRFEDQDGIATTDTITASYGTTCVRTGEKLGGTLGTLDPDLPRLVEA